MKDGLCETADEALIAMSECLYWKGEESLKKKIYIAGPMTGYPEFNFPAFFAVEDRFKKEGWVVFNPANKEDEEQLIGSGSYEHGDAKAAIAGGFDFRAAYKWDLIKVVEADAIYMLKGWEKSTGARGEHAAAVAMKQNYPEYEIIYE